jgi:hypothetical protein
MGNCSVAVIMSGPAMEMAMMTFTTFFMPTDCTWSFITTNRNLGTKS